MGAVGADRDAEQWFAWMIHDLNNPLAVVASSLDLAREQLGRAAGVPALAGEALDEAHDAIRRLRTLIDDVTLFMRLERGGVTLHPEAIDLSELVSSVLDGARRDADERSLAVTLRAGAEARAQADRAVLTRLLANLIESCIRHTPPRGMIEVSLEDGAQPGVRVGHTGPALAAEDQARVFAKTARVEGVTRAHAAPGVGLSFCKLAAITLGGDLELAGSEAWPTTFVLRLRSA